MIRKNGIKALIQELGVSGMVEFIRQFAPEVTITPEEVERILENTPQELPAGKRPLGFLKGRFKMDVDIKEIDISELFRPHKASE